MALLSDIHFKKLKREQMINGQCPTCLYFLWVKEYERLVLEKAEFVMSVVCCAGNCRKNNTAHAPPGEFSLLLGQLHVIRFDC